MRTGFAVTLLLLALVGCARAQTPDEAQAPQAQAAASAQSPVEIADGRQAEAWVDLTEWQARPPMQRATGAAQAHWRAQDPSYEEEVLVMDVVDGAFTEPGAEQQAVLYLMSPWPRCCPKMGLAVIEDGRLVRNVAFENVAQDLKPIPDLDRDGRDEIVYIGSFGMGGQNTTGFTLVSFGADGVTEWSGPSIQDDSCAAMQPGATAARVTALPGPEFTIERYSKATCEATEWQSVGGPEPLELDPQPGTSYVDLPTE
ncbi:MAG TPA: hypothetical protein VEY33_06570 [Gemmatimonadota bacterium]|nr:hypothetical protein [Gemmatimonadota bacterium]